MYDWGAGGGRGGLVYARSNVKKITILRYFEEGLMRVRGGRGGLRDLNNA